MSGIKYDISLSFAHEDMDYVSQITSLLALKKVRCFYDKHDLNNLWQDDLYNHLSNVFSQISNVSIVFISKNCASKLWADNESKTALSQAILENRDRMIFVRLDASELPDFGYKVTYINKVDNTPAQISDLILAKIGRETETVRSTIIIKRNSEEKKRYYSSFLARIFLSDSWNYANSFEVFLDEKSVGYIQNGSKLYIESTIGYHSLKAKCTQTSTIMIDGADVVSIIEAESSVFKFEAKAGENKLMLLYRNGNLEDNKSKGITPLYFTEF